MKKIHFLYTLLAGLLFLTSCEEDKETLLTPQNYLVGTWEIKQEGSLQNVNGQNVIQYSEYQNDSECEDSKDNIIFNEDFSYTQNDYTYDVDAAACQNDPETGTYSREGNAVILQQVDPITSEVSERVVKVTSLNYTTLEINYTDSDTNQLVFLKLEKKA